MTILAQITDLHIDNDVPGLQSIDPRAHALAVLDELQRQGIDQLVLSGDIAETPAGTDWVVAQLAQRGFQYRLIMGNHDLPDAFAAHGLLEPAHSYFAQEQDGFQLLFLDSSPYRVDEKQLAWLDEQLAQARQQVAIFIHHPVLDCGGTTMDRLYPLRNRDQVREHLLKANRPLTLFCGHYHTEVTITQGQLTQNVTPATFYQLKQHSEQLELASETPGYRLIELAHGRLTTSVRYVEPTTPNLPDP